MKRIAMGLVWLVTMAWPATAWSQDARWYVGGGLTRLHIHFEPDYTYVLNGTPEQFIDEADGLQVEATLGRRHRVNNRFSFGYQATFSANRFAWSLSIPEEPAELRYSLPRTFVAAAIPEAHVSSRVAAFLELGAGAGLVREIKTAATTSAYHYDSWRPVVAMGAGARVTLSECVHVVARYRQVRYAGFEYDTFNPAGVRIEHVKDLPRASGLSFGLVVDF